MESKETAVIACEVKISVTSGSYDEVKQLVERLSEACRGDYKLEINFHGEFFKPPNKLLQSALLEDKKKPLEVKTKEFLDSYFALGAINQATR